MPFQCVCNSYCYLHIAWWTEMDLHTYGALLHIAPVILATYYTTFCCVCHAIYLFCLYALLCLQSSSDTSACIPSCPFSPILFYITLYTHIHAITSSIPLYYILMLSLSCGPCTLLFCSNRESERKSSSVDKYDCFAAPHYAREGVSNVPRRDVDRCGDWWHMKKKEA